MEANFNSSRHFVLFDTFVSHRQVLFRSQKDDDVPYNIDVVFFGTCFIQSVWGFQGVTIQKVSLADEINCNSVEEFLKFDGNHIFEIKSGIETFYLIASHFQVFKNDLEFHETSLGLSNSRRGVTIFSC